jgi:ureidoglycolate hydrolase
MMPHHEDLEVHRVVALPLSADAFSPFGVCGKRTDREPDWVAGGSRITGVAETLEEDASIAKLWRLGDLEFDATPYFGSVRYFHQGFRVAELERHRGETQTWIAQSGTSVIVVARPTEKASDLRVDDVTAFVMEPGDAVSLGRAVWMCHFFPLGSHADYLLVTARRNPEQDRDLANFAVMQRTVLEIVFS